MRGMLWGSLLKLDQQLLTFGHIKRVSFFAISLIVRLVVQLDRLLCFQGLENLCLC